MSDEPRDHPAARAWRCARPDACPAVLVEQLRKERPNATLGRPRRGVFRLHHGRDTAPTIAKRKPRESLQTEYLIYQRVLPQLPLPPVRCLGFVADEDPERAWMFLEDVGGERYQSGRHDHRVVAARWLGNLHSFGTRTSIRALLPDRGPNHYLRALRWSCTQISAHLSGDHLAADDRRILLETLRALAMLEERWEMIAAWCDAMPHTLVHGDFVDKNCRVRKAAGHGLELVAFDWETAGWGVPAVDLATNAFGVHGVALERETYTAEIRQVWPGLGRMELEHAVRVGDAQRLVAAIQWSCETLVLRGIVQDDLRVYLPHLERAVRLVRGNDARRRGDGAARREAVREPAA